MTENTDHGDDSKDKPKGLIGLSGDELFERLHPYTAKDRDAARQHGLAGR